MRRIRLVLAVVAALAVPPGLALANGRFPATIDVHFKPGDHDVFALQATWGLITTFDGGDTWHWSCEEAVGFGGVYDPDYEFTATGLLLATTTSVDGMRLTRDMCTWSPAPPPLGPDGDTPSKFVSQIEVGPTGTIWAATPYEAAPAAQIYQSVDDGVTWTPLSRPYPGAIDWWETMEVAPTLVAGEARIYLTGYAFGGGGEKLRYLLRSDDSGATWTDLGVDEFSFGTDATDLQIAAVSPTDPDLVFARVFQANGSIGDDFYRSADAGETWTRVFQATDYAPGMVVRESGQVIIATQLSGVHVSADGGVTFGASVDDTKINCLKERDDQLLFACGVSFPPDDMALGTGTEVAAWTSMLTFAGVDDAYECAAGTQQQDVCDDLRWCFSACQFGIVAPECDCGFDGGLGPDAGEPDPPPGKTCCGAGDPTSAVLLALVVLPVALRRRKRGLY